MHENQPEITFSKIVQSIARPEMKDASTQYKAKDYEITTSTKVIESKVKSTSKRPSWSQSSQSSSSSHSGSQSSSSLSLVLGLSLFCLSQEEKQRSASRHSSERNTRVSYRFLVSEFSTLILARRRYF